MGGEGERRGERGDKKWAEEARRAEEKKKSQAWEAKDALLLLEG